MITAVNFKNFKSFSDERVKLGPFSIIIGTNASGKSNIRDAFRFIHGIGRGYSLPEIIGGKYGQGGQVEWEQLRGALNEIIQFGHDSFELNISLDVNGIKLKYHICVTQNNKYRGGFTIRSEELTALGSVKIFSTHPSGGDPVALQDDDAHLLVRMEKTGGQRRYGLRLALRPDQPALSQIAEQRNVGRYHKDIASRIQDIFASMRFLDLSPEKMRQPASPGQIVLGDSGENLPTVLQNICENPANKDVLKSWIRELTPMDVTDFQFPRDNISGFVQLVIIESECKKISAYSASDGTLRFLAMLAALIGTNPASLYFFEEIDNGIHPTRVRLLLDLIENQTQQKKIQVITTTHSPELLSMISDSTFSFTSVVHRSESTNDSIIRELSELPRISELRDTQGLDRLQISGWIDDAIELSDSKENL